MKVDYFPQGIATGEAFLGREEETNILKSYITLGHHCLLLAPRRFGKTSLVRHTLESSKFSFAEANFFLAKNEQAVEKNLLEAIQKLIVKTGGKSSTVIDKVSNFFLKSGKQWRISLAGVAGVELISDKKEEASENILTALNLLESLLIDSKKQAILFLDEIQEIASLSGSRAIQGAIREFAQVSKHVVFIFSGSNRRALHMMFDDRSGPLYELCERIKLDRINVNIYREYLNKVALETIGSKLIDAVFNKIVKLSKLHPKRIYNLCFQIWLPSPDKITVEYVEQCWNKLVSIRTSDIRYHLSQLSSGQLRVLTLIALEYTDVLTGKLAQIKVDLSGASISKILRLLEEGTYIESLPSGGYQVLDPVVKDVLKSYASYNLSVEV